MYSRINNNINGTHLGSKEKEGAEKTAVTDHTKEPHEEEKCKQWTEESMIAAIRAVKEDSTATLRAAIEHGVPRTTLQDRILGKVVHGTKPGPKPYLEPIEENELSNFLVDTAKAGFGKTRKEIKALIEKVAREKGVLKKQKVSDGWFRRFKERQPQLSLQRGDATANV